MKYFIYFGLTLFPKVINIEIVLQIILFYQINSMNFLNFLTSGAGIFNFNLQNHSLNANHNSLIRPVQILSRQKSQKVVQGQNQQDINHALFDQNHTPINSTIPIQLLNHQQQLINQYMHLNIQLLSQKIQYLENQPQKKQQSQGNDLRSNKKKIKKINANCGHNDRQHYAKGMCNNCYHKNGRTKKPSKCQHQKLYANGLCQNCYINKYNKQKREKIQPFQSQSMSKVDLKIEFQQ